MPPPAPLAASRGTAITSPTRWQNVGCSHEAVNRCPMTQRHTLHAAILQRLEHGRSQMYTHIAGYATVVHLRALDAKPKRARSTTALSSIEQFTLTCTQLTSSQSSWPAASPAEPLRHAPCAEQLKDHPSPWQVCPLHRHALQRVPCQYRVGCHETLLL